MSRSQKKQKDTKGKAKNRVQAKFVKDKKQKKDRKGPKQRAEKVTANEDQRVSIMEFMDPIYKELFKKGKKTENHHAAWLQVYNHCHR